VKEIDLSRKWSCNFVIECKVSRFSSTKAGLRVVNSSGPWKGEKESFVVKVYNSESRVEVPEEVGVLEDGAVPRLDDGGSGDSNGSLPPENGGNGDGGGGDEGDEYEEREFGPIMKFEDVLRETEKVGATLPSDLLEVAKTIGIRELLLMRYLELQVTNS